MTETAGSFLSFQDKVAIVTGSSSGIGLATTLILLAQGARVFGIDINPPPESLTSSQSFHHHTANLLDHAAAPAAVTACTAHFGPRIDVLLNIAGIADQMASAATVTPADWERVVGVNLTAAVELIGVVLPVMLAQGGGGSIVNVASMAGLSGAMAGVAYTAAKHGLVGATRQTAWRYLTEGIRCNAVCPGPVATNIQQSIDFSRMDMAGLGRMQQFFKAGGDQATQEGSIMDAGKVANVIVFLASPAAAGVNGAVVPVDGGLAAIGY